jgi:hypothetical protein
LNTDHAARAPYCRASLENKPFVRGATEWSAFVLYGCLTPAFATRYNDSVR